MKQLWIWMGSVAAFATATLASDSVVVAKGKIFSQTSAAAPAPPASGGFLFLSEAPGLGGPPLALGATVQPPTGALRNMTYVEADDVYRFTATADSAASLGASFAAGKYTVVMNSTIFGSLTVGPTLGADAYPTAPAVSNFAATQDFNPENDLVLNLAAIAGAAENDVLEVKVLDGAEVLSDDLYSGTESNPVIFAGTCQKGKTYDARIRYTRTVLDSTTFPSSATGFFSETRLIIRAGSGGPVVDLDPPTLSLASPTNHQAGVFARSPIVFAFSEPMDPSRTTVVWGGSVTAQDFSYAWVEGNTVLVATYGGGTQNLPKGTITWSLNPVAGAPGNLRDVAGNELPAGQYSGDFSVDVGGSTGGGCEGQSVVESAGFGMMKVLGRVQTGPSTLIDDPVKGASLMAFSTISDTPGRAALEFPPDPAPKPHKLKFFGQVPGTEFLQQVFPTQAELDAEYPPGTFDFQLRDRTTPTTVLNHVVLSLTAASYPPSPRFANYTAAQAINAHADFTLSWDAFTGATTNTDALTLEINDSEGITILSLPDTCANKLLSVTATSVVLPKDLLAEGKTYTANLTFFRAQDLGKTMPGSKAKGVTAAARSTTMTLKTTGGTVVAAPLILGVKLTNGLVELVVQCTPARVLRIESGPTPTGPFATVSTTTPAASPATVNVPVSANQAYYRAVSE